MGARVSVSFKKGNNESVVLFSHWGGRSFLNQALEYVDHLKERNKGKAEVAPLDRLEPETVMVDFIRFITKDQKEIDSDLYLGKDYNDGDNSDEGHWTIDLLTGKFVA